MKRDTIVVLDFGSQYTQLIARRVRELSVYSEILPYTIPFAELKKRKVKGIILSGGPASVSDHQAPRCTTDILELGVPVLGICYGLQFIASAFGSHVTPVTDREFGRVMLTVDDDLDLFAHVKSPTTVWMSHGDRVMELPPRFDRLAHTDNSPFAAIGWRDRTLYGIQFHPEVSHTEQGLTILRNFVIEICKTRGDWTPSSFISETIERMRETIGGEKVICGISGGVDSSVTAVLLHRAIGDRLTGIFVDNGLLREDEAHEVLSNLEGLGLKISAVQAEDRFLTALKGLTDPEEKRKAIGRTFIDVFQEEAKRLGGAAYLAQGTLYPDRIESSPVAGPSATIKTHHNVGALPPTMPFCLIEPLRDLFKDEVRHVGDALGLPHILTHRHPFPGPGLGVRILGEVTRNNLILLRQADRIMIEEIRSSGLYNRIWQAFCVLLPVQTVGVMGDRRTYEHVIVIRAVTSLDGMTADWFRFPDDVLAKISTRLVNEIDGINRVVYDITTKPPATIEWE